MIAHVKPYPLMKDSGVVWLGQVPKGWDVLRGRQLFEIRKRISGELGHPVISVTQEGLRVKDVESGEGQLSQDYSKYQTVGVGEFAMNSMDLLTGGVGIASSPGVTSPDYRVFAVRDKSVCSDRYMLHVLRMLYRNRGFYAWGQGSAQLGRWRLPRRRFNDFPFPVPSLAEQAAIARFLDWANGRLERAIRAKRRVIALLDEQKQAIIHKAVTRGLDPSVPLKPSGVEWTGQVPRHWEELPLRRMATSESSGSYGHELTSMLETIPVATTAQIDRHGTFDVERMPLRGFARQEIVRYACKPGDILVVKSSGSAANVISGKCGIVRETTPRFVFSNFLARFVAKEGVIEPEYLFLLLTSYLTKERVRRMVSTTTYPNLKMNEYRGALLPVPPLEEQRRILKQTLVSVQLFHTRIARLEREIELLHEYRTRLGADVVTGKLDVREAATQLPETAAEPEPGVETEPDREEVEV